MKPLASILAASALLFSPIFAHEGGPPEGAVARTALPEVKMPEQRNRSTLVSSMYALLPALGHTNWSVPRLMALTGYAFHFEVKEDGEPALGNRLDWGKAMEVFGTLGQVQTFDADKNSDVDLPALKAEARDAVVASLQQGVPALAWQPISVEQKGKVHGFCWGLIVGYQDESENYLIRHSGEELDYPVRFDAIGHTDPVEWFRVGIFERKDLDDHALHVAALRTSTAYANGVETHRHHSNPAGLGAWKIWRNAFDSEARLNATFANSESLLPRRKAAAAYLRELTGIYPDAAESLEAAAAQVDREVEAVTAIFDICVETANTEEKAFTADQRSEIQRLIDSAMKAEQAAVQQIELALETIDKP